MQIETKRLAADDPGLAQAIAILRSGGLVAMPTETVYGLAGDAGNAEAVARIFAAKGRPRFNPLIVHVADLAMAEGIARFDARARRVAAAFWPGALTLVLPLRAEAGVPALVTALVTAGLDSVAIRMPAHPLARALIAGFGGPLAAPSANRSGKVSPTTADHVLEGLAGRIEAVLDGGACPVGVESTILSLVGAPRLLRPGGIALEDLEALLGPVDLGSDAAERESGRPTSPGQLASHYAPEAPVRLEVTRPDAGEVWVGFGPECAGAALSLSPGGDLVEAAARLFQILRDADRLAGPGGRIAFAPVPEAGLGRAINDRLRRAAAPRG